MKRDTLERLDELRRRANPGVAPLWAAALAGEERLAALEKFGEGWALLLKAEALADLGRVQEADEMLAAADCAGPTLVAARERLGQKILAARHATDKRALAELTRWLASVRGWRGLTGTGSAPHLGAG